MATKQIAGSVFAPDGSNYISITDGAGNLTPLSLTDYPANATPVNASATGTTAVTTATLPGVSGKTTYIAGFNISSDATAAAAGTATITGLISGTMSIRQGTGLTPAVIQTGISFYPPIPASATNTAIAIISAAPGAGGNIAVSAWGFQL